MPSLIITESSEASSSEQTNRDSMQIQEYRRLLRSTNDRCRSTTNNYFVIKALDNCSITQRQALNSPNDSLYVISALSSAVKHALFWLHYYNHSLPVPNKSIVNCLVVWPCVLYTLGGSYSDVLIVAFLIAMRNFADIRGKMFGPWNCKRIRFLWMLSIQRASW